MSIKDNGNCAVGVPLVSHAHPDDAFLHYTRGTNQDGKFSSAEQDLGMLEVIARESAPHQLHKDLDALIHDSEL